MSWTVCRVTRFVRAEPWGRLVDARVHHDTGENVATMPKKPKTPDFVQISDLAELLGVQRQRAGELVRRQGFPGPIYKLRTGDCWDVTEVREWAASEGRQLTR